MRKFLGISVELVFGLMLLILGSTTVSWATAVPEIIHRVACPHWLSLPVPCW